jgi:tRNA (guanine37-N1)-methyltransferase
MKFGVVTLFPEMFESITRYGVTSRAIKQGLISVESWNPRDFTHDKHHTVDDRPYGGGPGMVMMIEPIKQALNQAKEHLKVQTSFSAPVIYLSPQGSVFKQEKAKQLSSLPAVILLAGRYEGVDQRLIDQCVDEEISVGDFVVSGGELPAMIVIDAVARCLPGVLGHEHSAQEDSFFEGLLDHPHYTRPEDEGGLMVPPVLLSGNHEAIRVWRLQQALGQTWLRRPDLLTDRCLTKEEQRLLAEFQKIRQENTN